MIDRDAEKQLAARAAVALVENGMRVGLGSGSSAAHAVRLLGERVRSENLDIVGVPTSIATRDLAASVGIPLADDLSGFELDIAIDGADEITRKGDAIKGGGGAMFHERIVAAAARTFVVIVDSSKLVDRLGGFPLPVEVCPFGWRNVAARLERLGCRVTRRMAEQTQPFLSQERNFVLDCQFDRDRMPPLVELDRDLRAIAGVIEHGLFLRMADLVLIGRADGVESIAVKR